MSELPLLDRSQAAEPKYDQDDGQMSNVFRANKPWSLAEDERLRALMAEGKTARAIAAYFKRTTRAVRRRAERLKLSWRKATRNDETDARQQLWTENEVHQLKPLNTQVCE
jgi:serine/threonine-protein kinase RIO1